MVDRFSQPKLKYLSLEPSLEEVLDLEAKDVIKLHPGLVKHADANEAAQERVALEQPPRVLLLERKEIPGGLAALGESELDAPYLALVPQAVLADQLQLLIKAGLLEGASRCRVHLRVDEGNATVHHLEVEGSRELPC